MPVHQDVVHEASHACAATTRAFTPVSRVGWITGAKRGLWLVGSELSVPSFFALSYTSGSSPPKNQNTAGACQSAPKHPKSSLAIVGLVCSTEPSGKFWRNASTTFSVASGGAKDSNAFEWNKTTKATHARGEQSTDSCHIDRRRAQALSALRPWRRCGGEDRRGRWVFPGRSVCQLRR